MLCLVTLVLLGYAEDPVHQVSVGMTGRIEGIVLPGSELEAKPYDDRKTSILLRVISRGQVGTGYRYDLEYQGYDPGTYDLRNYLQRKDGSSASDLPGIPIKVEASRPPGQIVPHVLETDHGYWLGGYRWWLIAGLLLWCVGLFCIVYYGFWPQRRNTDQIAATPVTLADRLRPLVEKAVAGESSPEELAWLERCLLAWWRRKLTPDAKAIQQGNDSLRLHAEAGPLLQQLELWLHRPGSSDQVDVARLLEPYRHVQADALDEVEKK